MNYADIKKYGKTLTVNGKPFVKVIDDLANIMWSCGICLKANAKKNVIADIEKGRYSSEMYQAIKTIETIKAIDVL